MRFSVQWLLALCPLEEPQRQPHSLAEALTSRGLTVDAVEPAASGDHVLDVDVPANRPDCLGHLGLARELAAAFGAPLREPPALESGGERADWGRVGIAPGAGCTRYTAAIVRNVRVCASPRWVVERLEACGLRTVNNVVDASNLVLLELGHPVHFFDRAKLAPARQLSIEVRNARSAEALVTLGGVSRTLDPAMLVIAESGRAVALAGIIGGEETGIDEATREVLVEAAHFEPRQVRSAAKRLGIQTDASFRFARGVDPRTAPAAQALAARLLVDLAGAEPPSKIADVWPTPPAKLRSELRASEIERLLGYRPEDVRVSSALAALGLAPELSAPGRWQIVVPSWRIDLEREADLVEEVVRHLGYAEIPSLRPAIGDAVEAKAPPAERIRDLLSYLGFHEAFGYSMIAAGEDDRFVRDNAPTALALTNPIAEPMARMRRSILPGLLRALELNLRRGMRDVRLFEAGRVFLARTGELPQEPAHAGVVWCGTAETRHWSRPPRPLDLYDLTGIAARALEALGSPAIRIERAAIGRSAFHPGVGFCWSDRSGDRAWGGALHPDLADRFGVPVYALELRLDGAGPSSPPRYAPLARFPTVTRDLAIVLPAGRAFAEVLQALDEIEAPAPAGFEVVDRYEGAPLAAGEASLTVRFTLEPRERTLTDAETEAYRARIVDALERGLGLRLRA